MAFGVRYNAPVILTYSLLCTAIVILDQLLGGVLMPYFTVGTSINIYNPLSILTLVTHVLGHGSFEHLWGNLTFILLLGPIIEEKYGSRTTFMMIFVTALLTGILNVMFFNSGLLGASGIVFMLILLASFTNVYDGRIPLTFILVTILFLGREIINIFNDDQISQFAHIIGGACGSVFGYLSTTVAKKYR